jgi:hypothetical protein
MKRIREPGCGRRPHHVPRRRGNACAMPPPPHAPSPLARLNQKPLHIIIHPSTMIISLEIRETDNIRMYFHGPSHAHPNIIHINRKSIYGHGQIEEVSTTQSNLPNRVEN